MRDYGRVYSAFWQSPEMRALPEDARTLALYLLTCPHANLVGCFRLSDGYAADDLQWGFDRVRDAMTQLAAAEFVTRDASGWLVIHKYVKWNAFENANVAKAAVKAFGQVPSLRLKAVLAEALVEFGQHLSEGFLKDCQTLVESFANPEPEPIQSRNQNQNQSPTGTDSAQPPAGGRAKRESRAVEAAPTAGVWSAYAAAYERRYQAPPVRNAKVNGQLSQLVGRLGAEEAPHVAAFYVGHQSAFYVRAMHPVDLLLKDAEKLRTEFVTNRQTTVTQAMQSDRTQTNLNAFGPLLAIAEAKEKASVQ